MDNNNPEDFVKNLKSQILSNIFESTPFKLNTEQKINCVAESGIKVTTQTTEIPKTESNIEKKTDGGKNCVLGETAQVSESQIEFDTKKAIVFNSCVTEEKTTKITTQLDSNVLVAPQNQSESGNKEEIVGEATLKHLNNRKCVSLQRYDESSSSSSNEEKRSQSVYIIVMQKQEVKKILNKIKEYCITYNDITNYISEKQIKKKWDRVVFPRPNVIYLNKNEMKMVRSIKLHMINVDDIKRYKKSMVAYKIHKMITEFKKDNSKLKVIKCGNDQLTIRGKTITFRSGNDMTIVKGNKIIVKEL